MLTGEHGVGVEKRDLMGTMFSDDDLKQQQRIKCAFDPDQLLNPGKVFPTLHRCAELGQMHVHRGETSVSRPAPLLMTDSLAPKDADGLADAVRWAVAGEHPAGGAGRRFQAAFWPAGAERGHPLARRVRRHRRLPALGAWC